MASTMRLRSLLLFSASRKPGMMRLVHAFRSRCQEHRIRCERNVNPDVAFGVRRHITLTRCAVMRFMPRWTRGKVHRRTDTRLKEGMSPRQGVGALPQHPLFLSSPFQSCCLACAEYLDSDDMHSLAQSRLEKQACIHTIFRPFCLDFFVSVDVVHAQTTCRLLLDLS